LSSGTRINHASDDAAGLAISEKMRAQIRGLIQAERNIQDGISLIQTAEEGLANILSPPLQRMRELAVQAANYTLTAEDRFAIQNEIEQPKQAIEEIVQNTNFNGQVLLKGINDSPVVLPSLNPDIFFGIDRSGTQFSSADGINWSIHATTGAGNNTNGLTYGINQFVVVGDNGLVRTSVDGTSWTSQTSGTSNILHNVIYGGNQFIAVGENGTILTSAEGSTWISRTSGTNSNLINVNWKGNKYVAVGENSTILTSSDGITWSTRYSGTTNTLRGIEWDGNNYVAMGDSGKFFTSSDGTSWSLHNTNISSNLYDVAWSGSNFVASTDDGSILSSSDGISWTTQVQSTGNSFYDVTWSGKEFVISGGMPSSKGIILSSTEGSSWITRISGAYAPIQAMIWAGSANSNEPISLLKPRNFSLQIGGNSNQTVQISFNDVGLESLSISSINLQSSSTAEDSISKVDLAIQKITSEQAKLGSLQNRLEHTSNYIGNSEMNLTAAESRIRDTDMAKEIMEQTKYSILTQATQAILAQSNQMPQGVLQLLR
jgi:flagellin